jgi:hypothetical protein
MQELIPEIRAATYLFMRTIGFIYIFGGFTDRSPSNLRLLIAYIVYLSINLAWKS